MTTPDLSFIIPTKYKAIVGLIGTGLSFAVPLVLQYTDSLPAPWPAVIGFVLWVLTVLGIYHAPYAPPGAVLVPPTAVKPPPPAAGEYRNPWQ